MSNIKPRDIYEEVEFLSNKVAELTVENERLEMELRDARRQLSKYYKDEVSIDVTEKIREGLARKQSFEVSPLTDATIQTHVIPKITS